jgi:hypothetical protein
VAVAAAHAARVLQRSLAARTNAKMAAAKAPQAQLITGSGEVSEELDGFVRATGLASWGLDYQARALCLPLHARCRRRGRG